MAAPERVPAPSTIPALKAALVDRLERLAWPASKPDVSYGLPREFGREQVAVLDTEQTEQVWATVGAGRQRDEVYVLGVIVSVLTPGNSQREATERAFELAGCVELLLRETHELGVPGVWSVETSSLDLVETPDPDGYVAEVTCRVRVQARI